MGDKEWYEEFSSMPMGGTCDANCGEKASRWFGNTNRATCGNAQCVDILQDEYDSTVI